MCLFVNRIKTIQEWQNRAPRVFYKVFVKATDHLFTPYWRFSVNAPGQYCLANAVSFEDQEMIGKGAFHARTKESALVQDEYYCEHFELGKPVRVPILVDVDEITAFGVVNDVALRAFTITHKTWDSIFKKAKS